MTNPPENPQPVAAQQESADIIHALMRFLRVLRFRKNVVCVTLLIACVLGMLYFITAQRMYQATAKLLVLQTSAGGPSRSGQAQQGRNGLLATSEKLFTSGVVLKDATAQLQQVSLDDRLKMSPTHRESWTNIRSRNLHVQAIRRTDFMEVSYQSEDPYAAVAVVNAVVDSYIKYMEKTHRSVSAEMVEKLSQDLEKNREQLRQKGYELLEAQNRVHSFGLDDKTMGTHPVIERVFKVSQERIGVQQKRAKLEADLISIKLAIQNGGDLRQYIVDIEPTLGKELILSRFGISPSTSQMVFQYKRKILDANVKLNREFQHKGTNHPAIKALQAEIRTTEVDLKRFQQQAIEQLNNTDGENLQQMLLAMLREELAKSWQHEQRLNQEYKQAEQEAVDLNIRMAEVTNINREVALLTKSHDSLLEWITNVDINQGLQPVRVSVVTEPMPAKSPISPRLSLVVLLCLGCGLGSGLVLVYILDVLDDRFRSPEELREQLGTPVLAMVRPLQTQESTGVEALQVYKAPDAIESESFRTLRTALAFSGTDVSRLVISSSEPGDGKTTVLANLAASYAQAGRKTLMIDGDLRRPGLTTLFGLRNESGLSDLLKSHDDLMEMCSQRIYATEIEGLDILPSGPRPPNPSELLHSPRLGDLFSWVETVYDQVLIDSPPVLAASDAVILGRLVDGIALVIQPEKNHRRRVIRAVESIASLGISLVGVVINRAGLENDKGYYGYNAGYNYGYVGDYDYGYSEDPDEQPDQQLAEDYGVQHGEEDPEDMPPQRAA